MSNGCCNPDHLKILIQELDNFDPNDELYKNFNNQLSSIHRLATGICFSRHNFLSYEITQIELPKPFSGNVDTKSHFYSNAYITSRKLVDKFYSQSKPISKYACFMCNPKLQELFLDYGENAGKDMTMFTYESIKQTINERIDLNESKIALLELQYFRVYSIRSTKFLKDGEPKQIKDWEAKFNKMYVKAITYNKNLEGCKVFEPLDKQINGCSSIYRDLITRTLKSEVLELLSMGDDIYALKGILESIYLSLIHI